MGCHAGKQHSSERRDREVAAAKRRSRIEQRRGRNGPAALISTRFLAMRRPYVTMRPTPEGRRRPFPACGVDVINPWKV
jgi:hypothetical protein